MAENILRMRRITKTFPGVKALQDVNLDVARGEVHAICGENGAGKSTLMKVLSGVYPHGTYDGEIEFEGSVAEFKDIRDSEHDGIVIIHQELALSPFLSVAENIFLGNERGKRGFIDWNETNVEAAKLLRRVGLDLNPVVRAGDIGVGKQQLVEIAKALSKNVKLLILDEPTAALNDEDSAHLLGLVKGLRAEGITCIIISHKLNEIREIADSVTILRDGRTIETLSLHDGSVTEERIIKGMVGRDMESRYPDRTPSIGEEVLRVEDWTVHHPQESGRVIVDAANLAVRAGEVVGIAGLMGAGRTELAMSIFGRSYGSNITGTLYKNGAPITARTVAEAIRHGIAYATEDRKKYGLNLIDDIKRNVSGAAPRQAGEARLGRQRPRGRRRGRLPAVHEHQGPDRHGHHRQALRREPAEGGALQVDVLGPRRPDPRRTHPRDRRRRQVRDLHDHQPPGSRGEGRHRHLLGTPRTARHLRPHLHARRRPHHGRSADRPGNPGTPHAAHDQGKGLIPWQPPSRTPTS
ncbi:hypothetical protein MN0502_03840 [Arthrobacter sp. MN05-02]|nr:hypothetical protein MN0502_03840 [Arthrobacter sp. MN05-02]